MNKSAALITAAALAFGLIGTLSAAPASAAPGADASASSTSAPKSYARHKSHHKKKSASNSAPK